MKSSTRLDSVVFHLTPTRTRCDLLVTANGKTEKIATGLIDPFLAHLKTAQDQVAKGGYSIILEPQTGDNATWFTKGTILRFVRFVSNPEVLERVYTLETEILQIKEAIKTQNNCEIALNVVEDSLRGKRAESTEGNRSVVAPNEEKAIVLYQPDANPKQANGATAQEENSKAQVLKVMETRQTVLQKEQGMAFARAVAAGFDADDMAPLISFAKTFGALRLTDACLKFVDLWKKKHETGQWVEIEATEVMATQPDLSAMNDSGIMLANMRSLPNTPEKNDVKSPTDNKPNVHQEYLQGQLPQPMYAPWPVHSPPGTFPVFQGYPMQGMPYYPGYPGSGQYPSPYPSTDDSRHGSGQRKARKHHSSSEDSESEEEDTEKTRSGRRRKSGKVVIRNINYISSKKQSHSGSESDADSDEEGERGEPKERATKEKEADNGNWQAFQTYLLQDADRDERSIDHMMEKEITGKKRQSAGQYDPLAYDEREREHYQEGETAGIGNGDVTRGTRRSSEPFISSKRGHGDSRDFRIHGQADVDGKRVYHGKHGSEDFMIHQRENGFRNSSDPLTFNGFDNSRNGQCNMGDDSYITRRSADEAGSNKRNVIDMGSEISSFHQTDGNERKQVNYEPHDLSLMPERETAKLSLGYDPSLDIASRNVVQKINQTAPGAKKSTKDPKSRLANNAADNRKASGPIRRGRPTKMSPLDEAKARADKLRNFKADLQKMKKEKEEEERKRIEALKIERQKRIASKSNSAVGQAKLPTQQPRKPVVNKFSPGAPRGSKFSDSESGPLSPLQRLPIRTASLGSNDSQKFSKNGKLSTGSKPTVNRLTRSISPLPMSKRESRVPPHTQNKSSVTRTRRLSEPKMGTTATGSSVRSRGRIVTKKVADAPEIKKLSAIVNYDIAKIASLPELKIKVPKGPKSSASEAGNKKKPMSDVHETPVIEKTVVMEKPCVPALRISAQSKSTDQMHLEKPISEEADKEAIEAMHENGNDIVLVRLESLSDLVTETPKFLTSQSVAEKPYQAPYARVSSMEEPCKVYSESLPTPSIQSNETEHETVKVFVPERISEVSDKSQTKDSASKGLRKLLKFGRKSQPSSTSEHLTDSSSAAAVNSSEDYEPTVTTATSSEAFTLKSLISQDETPTAATASQKSSRHFSLLSPFKNKKIVS